MSVPEQIRYAVKENGYNKGRFLLEETVINPASVCAQITDDRHAVHIASEDGSTFIHGQAKGVGNGVFYGLLRNGI